MSTGLTLSGQRGPIFHHAAVRLADEGVPVAAIARALNLPFSETVGVVTRAKVDGHITAVPPTDWPHGQVRYVPSNVPPAEGSVGSRRVNLDEAREAIPWVFRLTGKETEVLAALMARDSATKNWLHSVLYGFDPNGGAEIKIIDVLVCKIRRKLRPHDITIETVWGRGYHLLADGRTKILKIRRDEIGLIVGDASP